MLRKPPALRAGDLIGVVAPAGAVDEPALTAGLRALEAAGYPVRCGASVLARTGYLAGADDDRADDLLSMFRDPDVRAVFGARGGYGSGRLLARLDPRVLRDHPKIFVGHSDLTFLLNHLVQAAGLVAFHGPMVTGLPSRPEALAALCALLAGDRREWEQSAATVVRPGSGEGPLVGGCLSIVVSMLGTPHAMETRGRLLFLEDVNERPYRIDRMLTQLWQAGAFDDVAGVIFGEMEGCVGPGHDPVSVHDVIRERFADARFPVVAGLHSGHGVGRLTLPLGVRARLTDARLMLLESPVTE